MKKALQKGGIISIRDTKKGIGAQDETYSIVDFNAFEVKLYHLYNSPIGIDFQKSYSPTYFLTIRYILSQLLQLPRVTMELRYKCEQLLDSMLLGKVTVYQSLIPTYSSSASFHDPSYPLALLQFLVDNHPNLPQIPSLDITVITQFLGSPETHEDLLEKWQKSHSIPSEYPHILLVIHSLVNIIKQYLNPLTDAGCTFASNVKILDQISALLPTGQWSQIHELIQTFPMTLPLLTIEDRSQLLNPASIDTNLTSIISSRKENENKSEKKNKGKKEKEIPAEKEKTGLSNDHFIEDTFLFLQIISPHIVQGR